jgi:hypothetical protein
MIRIGTMLLDSAESGVGTNLSGAPYNALRSALSVTDLAVGPLQLAGPVAHCGVAITARYAVIAAAPATSRPSDDWGNTSASHIVEEAYRRLLDNVGFPADRQPALPRSVILRGMGINSPYHSHRWLNATWGDPPLDAGHLRSPGVHTRALPEVTDVQAALHAWGIPFFAGLGVFGDSFPDTLDIVAERISGSEPLMKAIQRGAVAALMAPSAEMIAVPLDAVLWIAATADVVPAAVPIPMDE